MRTYHISGFTGGSDGKESTCKESTQAARFDPWAGKIRWRRKSQPTPVFLPREFHGPRSLVGYSPRGCKESDTTERLHFHILRMRASPVAQLVKNPPAMWETWVQFLGWEDPLEEGRAWPPTPVFLPGEFHGPRSLVGYSPWGCKESAMTE